MMKGKLNWFDRMMINITFAEADAEEPDLTYMQTKELTNKSPAKKEVDEYEPFDGETVPVQ